MKINTLLLTSAVAAAPAPAQVEKRQATTTFAGSCTTLVPLLPIQGLTTTCSYAASAGPYTGVTCNVIGVDPLNVGLCYSATVPSTCATSTVTRFVTSTYAPILNIFGIFETKTSVFPQVSAQTSCTPINFSARGAVPTTAQAPASPGLPALTTVSPILPAGPTAGAPLPAAPSVAVPALPIPTGTLTLAVPSLALTLSAPSVALTLPSTSIGLSAPTLPSAALPSAALPSAALPSAALPSAALPSAALPSAALPSPALPSAALPSVNVPGVATTVASVVLPAVSSAAAAVKAVPLVVANGGSPATFAGCYADSTNARSLPTRVGDVGSVDQCVAACSAQGFALAGVEYTNECYCGNAISAPQIALSNCQTYTCNANALQYCGGDNALQVYRLSGAGGAVSSVVGGVVSSVVGAGAATTLALPAVPTTTIAIPPAATTAAGAVKSIPLVVANGASPATFSGCYIDSTNARSLPTRVGDVGSVEQCVSACSAQGFALAGVEYTNECYCGNEITAPQIAVANCQKYTCNANALEFCGGDNALQVYRLSSAGGAVSSVVGGVVSSVVGAGAATTVAVPAVPTTAATTAAAAAKSIPLVVANGASPATFAGCYTDSTNARSLSTRVADVGSVDQCVAACSAQGFALAGVEYTNECYCGNAISAPQIALSSCQQYTCNANSLQFCGGDNALQVYRLSGAGAVVSSVAGAGAASTVAVPAVPTTVAGIPAAGTSAVSAAKSIPLVVANGASTAAYSGCYADSINARSLPTRVGDVGSVDQCVAACSAQGFTFAGVEYTNECYCGNAITAPQIADSNCKKYTCNANALQYCGGDNSIQVYRLSGSAAGAVSSVAGVITATTVAVPAVPTTAAGLPAATTTATAVKAIPLVVANGGSPATFAGCYTDSTSSRTLSTRVADVGSVEQCVAACSAQGFALAGVEYTNECFCGNTITANQIATASCQQYTCKSAANEYCGGDNAIQVYRLSGGAASPTTVALPVATIAPAATSAPVSGAMIPLITTSGATFKACYLDNIGARALRNRLADVTDSMPVNTCATMCKSAGYSLSGLEFGHECWCDNSINNGQTITSNNDCSQLCDGNNAQYCGNADRVQVYNV